MLGMFSEKTSNPFWLRWGPAIVVMAVIFAFSSIPSGRVPSFGPPDALFKKGGHLIGYGLLGLAYLHALGRHRPESYWQAWLLAILYAVSDEIHQSFVPGRGPWIVDVGIDALGALTALFLARRSA